MPWGRSVSTFEDFFRGVVAGFTQALDEQLEEKRRKRLEAEREQKAREERQRLEQERYREIIVTQAIENARQKFAVALQRGEAKPEDWPRFLEQNVPPEYRDHPFYQAHLKIVPHVETPRVVTVGELAQKGEIPGWDQLPEGIRKAVANVRVTSAGDVQSVITNALNYYKQRLENAERNLLGLARIIQQKRAAGEDTTQLEAEYQKWLQEHKQVSEILGLQYPTVTVRITPDVEIVRPMTPETPAARVAREYGVPRTYVETKPGAKLEVPATFEVPGVPERVRVEPPKTWLQVLQERGLGNIALAAASTDPGLAAWLTKVVPSDPKQRDQEFRVISGLLSRAGTRLGQTVTRHEQARYRQALDQIRDKARLAAVQIRETGNTDVNINELMRQAAQYGPAFLSEIQGIIGAGIAQRHGYMARKSEQTTLRERREAEAREKEARSVRSQVISRMSGLVSAYIRYRSVAESPTAKAVGGVVPGGPLDKARADLDKAEAGYREVYNRAVELGVIKNPDAWSPDFIVQQIERMPDYVGGIARQLMQRNPDLSWSDAVRQAIAQAKSEFRTLGFPSALWEWVERTLLKSAVPMGRNR